MTFRPLLSVLSIAFIAGCPSTRATDAARTPDAFSATPDAFVAMPDALVEFDAFVATVDASDAGSDALRSGDTRDAGPPSDAGCSYDPIDDVVVKCGDTYRFVTLFREREMTCPDFYGFTPTGPRFASFAAAIASEPTCDASCVYRFSIAVTRLWCGRRSGYDVLRAEGCAQIYRFPAGYYDSVESHDVMVPCPAP